ncbi:MAG: hypothetical protein Q7K16_04555 [Candidatus Azambacteria bacterium]|nr:hypothetical protein [Candidatus Azambacteria bacterium]
MTKTVQLKLSKIKYSGDSVGRNIRVELEVLGKFSRIDKRIKAGTTAEINHEVGRFETDSGLLQADVLITVIEKDLLFNDVGNTKGNIKVNTAVTKPQQFVFEVQVREMRSIFGKFWGTKTAVFEITLEVEVLDAIRYVPDKGEGWLIVKIGDKPTKESLPDYLKVKIDRTDNKYDYFTILEGPYRGESAFVELDKGSSQFITGVRHEPMARAKYSISQKIFILNGKKYKTTDYPETPWRKGLYDIEIPDAPHKGGGNYISQSKRARTWFRIGHDGERYLHAGGFSLGCITVIEANRWTEIYNALIKARKGDFMSVGVLEVVD